MVGFASVLDVGDLSAVGQLQCLNVYDSDRPEADEISVKRAVRVRLIEGVPRPLPEGGPVPTGATQTQRTDSETVWPPPGVETRILGEAPVEADGSFYVNVAGDVPFYIQILDDRGIALQTMRAWAWVRSGDQRGCIGCHEDKELAPENRATQALLKMQPSFLPEKQRLGVGWDSR